jgi:hypothetical protein
MDPGLLSALTTGIKTGLSPAQPVTLNPVNVQPEPTDNTFFTVIIIAALLVAAGTVYFITAKK